MSGTAVAILGFGVMLGLIAIRMPVAIALILVGSSGYIYFAGLAAFLNYMNSTPYHLFSNYTLSVIPLFLLMGAFSERSGLSTSLFKAASGFVGHYRGGLAMSLIWACAAFGAICGSAVATTATFGRAVFPELRRSGYDASFAAGTVAAGGTLGLLIPPSVILVIYAILAQQNIAKLFMAAFVPGILAAIFYCIVIIIIAKYRPQLVPSQSAVSWHERMLRLIPVWPVLVVALIVVGGIYGGVVTTTEAAALGAVAMLVVCVCQRSIGLKEIGVCLLQTAETSAMIFLILLGAEVFNAFLSLSQLPNQAAEIVSSWNLPPYGVLAILIVVYIVLGGLMDEIAMVLLTMPVFFPIVMALDFGLTPDDAAIWFGILLLMLCGVGLLAPPIGLGVFIISSIGRDVPIAGIYRSVLPYLAADVVRIMLVAAFPSLALATVYLLQR